MIKQCRLLNYSDIACVIHGGTIMSVMSEIYGGGYYDRYLEDFTGKTVSTIYSIQQKEFQPDTFDQAVQEVLVYEVTL